MRRQLTEDHSTNDGENMETSTSLSPAKEGPRIVVAVQVLEDQCQQQNSGISSNGSRTEARSSLSIPIALHRDSAVTDLSFRSPELSPRHERIADNGAGDVQQERLGTRGARTDSVSPFRLSQDETLHGWTMEPETSYPESIRDQRWVLRSFPMLHERRNSVAGMRFRVRELRHKLRTTRDNLNERENQLMQRLRLLFAGDGEKDLDTFTQLQDYLQEARDTFRNEESDYDFLEDRLLNDEWQLKEVEKGIYQRVSEMLEYLLKHEPLSELGTRKPSADETASASGPADDVMSVTVRWLDHLRSREKLEERLRDLDSEHEKLTGEAQMRAEVNLNLKASSAAALCSIPERRIKLQQELAAVEEDLSRLRQVVEDQADVHFAMDQFADLPKISSSCESLDSGLSDPLEPEKRDPLLASWDDISDVFPGPIDANTTEDLSTITLINDWLLHTLQRSILQVSRFKSAEVLKKLDLDKKYFKDLVLRWWFHDALSIWPDMVRDEAESCDPSLDTNTAETRNAKAKSESYLGHLGQVKRQLRMSKIPGNEESTMVLVDLTNRYFSFPTSQPASEP